MILPQTRDTISSAHRALPFRCQLYLPREIAKQRFKNEPISLGFTPPVEDAAARCPMEFYFSVYSIGVKFLPR